MNEPTKNTPAPLVKLIQTGLATLGFYAGEIDGDWGPMSRAGYARYRKTRTGLNGTGKPGVDTAFNDPDNWWSGPAHLAQRTGVRLNNPLCIKGTGWKGRTGNDSRGHAIFSAPEYGVRAAAYQLRINERKHGKRTIAQQLSRWAPATDTIGSIPGAPPNSPGEYTRFVCDRAGILPNETLNLFPSKRSKDRDKLAAIIKAMAEYEIGHGFKIDDRVVLSGIDLLAE